MSGEGDSTPTPTSTPTSTGPHDGQPIETAGAPFAVADAAVVLLHGRGGSPTQFLRLADEFHHRSVLYLAPEAAGRVWFPGSLEKVAEDKEPWLSSAFGLVERALAVAGDAGVPPHRTVFVGFSQGASLAAEYVASHPRRYGGLAVLAGSLLGPDAAATGHEGSLDGTPVVLGCGTADPHVAPERIRGSASPFRRLDADVTDRLYDGLEHAINDDEVRKIDRLVEGVAPDAR